jgi:hypothetical protein
MPAPEFKLKTEASLGQARTQGPQQELKALWDSLLAEFPSGVSSTSTAKYRRITEWWARLVDISAGQVYATGAATSRTSNLDTRLVQGNQVERHTTLGLAFVQAANSPEDLERIANSAETTATKFVRPGTAGYDTVAVIIELGGFPFVAKTISLPQSSIRSRLESSFPLAQHKVVTAPAIASNRVTTPATNIPLNLVLTGPPGCGKTHRMISAYRPVFEEGEAKRWELVTFHPSFAYEDFVEGIRPTVVNGGIVYEVASGIFKSLADKAALEPTKRFALFIDEINRGNVAAIFGELISLIEEDKRSGVVAMLPYSKTRFTVPPNLHIIATMNSADRSVAALDAALRRRFEFEELRPDISVLEESLRANGLADGTVDGVSIPDLLQSLNDRIELVLGRDFVVGHSFLMGVRSLSDLMDAFDRRIFPLLQEYFADDLAKLCQVLGEDPHEERADDFVEKIPADASAAGDMVREAGSYYGQDVLYRLKPRATWTGSQFRRLAVSGFRSQNGES